MAEILKSHKCFEGLTQFWSHSSETTKTEMKFSTFIPEGEVRGCLIWLSGLTCNEENFISKAGAQKYLAQEKLMVIAPDTSPRGLELPGEHDSYDFGSGAGFYLNAQTEGYRDHYRMYDYIVSELYELIQKEFNVSKISIMGHSMGGHGALVIGLREPKKFRSVSAFSPIVNPCGTPWGKKAFSAYLGDDTETWKQYDAVELIKAGRGHPNRLLVDQGTGDDFLDKELFPEELKKVCEGKDQKLELNLREGYDHSYYFISTFIGDHVKFHSKHM